MAATLSRFNWAPTAHRLLNGALCIYKPADESIHKVLNSIKTNLMRDLNALPCYEHEIPLGQATIDENRREKRISLQTEAMGVQDWSEHRLVLGARYTQSDIFAQHVDELAADASGVVVVGVGEFGLDTLRVIADAKFLRVYHVKGRFGWATDDFTAKGHILDRTRFRHVNRSKLERVCAAAQAAYSRQMYRLQGVDPDSQEAYELASSSGIIRPATRQSEPVLYGIKCIDFQPPDFTLEIHSINETTKFLQSFIHDTAVKLKTLAVCTGVRRIRYGAFDLRRSLVRQQWHLDPIIDNIESNIELLTPQKLFVGAEAQKLEQLSDGQHAGYLTERQRKSRQKWLRLAARDFESYQSQSTVTVEREDSAASVHDDDSGRHSSLIDQNSDRNISMDDGSADGNSSLIDQNKSENSCASDQNSDENSAVVEGNSDSKTHSILDQNAEISSSDNKDINKASCESNHNTDIGNDQDVDKYKNRSMNDQSSKSVSDKSYSAGADEFDKDEQPKESKDTKWVR